MARGRSGIGKLSHLERSAAHKIGAFIEKQRKNYARADQTTLKTSSSLVKCKFVSVVLIQFVCGFMRSRRRRWIFWRETVMGPCSYLICVSKREYARMDVSKQSDSGGSIPHEYGRDASGKFEFGFGFGEVGSNGTGGQLKFLIWSVGLDKMDNRILPKATGPRRKWLIWNRDLCPIKE